MRHDIRIDGFAFDLRPVTLNDAELIVQLRSDPGHSRYLHPVSPDVSKQQAWLENYFTRKGEYYFAFEHKRRGTVEGFAGIYNLDEDLRRAEWGRWVLQPKSLAAVESALLVYRAAFDILGLETIYCRTVAENVSVVSFHESCGLKRSADSSGFFVLNGVRFDFVEHRLTKSEWPDAKMRLSLLAERIAGRIKSL